MILALSNSKGGVGKTTIAVHLAIWIAEQEHNVVFVDSDVQCSSSIWLKTAAPEMKVHRLVTADDVLMQLPLIASEADYVVADGPAGLSEVTRSLFYRSDLAILPCGPSIIDLRALIDATKVITELKMVSNGLPNEIVIPNKIQPHYRLTQELLKALKNCGMPCGDGLHFRQAYVDAATQGTVVWKLNTQSARDATAEMQFLFQQILSYATNPSNNVRGVTTNQ